MKHLMLNSNLTTNAVGLRGSLLHRRVVMRSVITLAQGCALIGALRLRGIAGLGRCVQSVRPCLRTVTGMITANFYLIGDITLRN